MKSSGARQNALEGKYGGWSANLHGLPRQITVRTHDIAELKPVDVRNIPTGPAAESSVRADPLASWLTVCRGLHPARVGIFLSCWQNAAGAYAMQAILDEWKAGGAVKNELGGTAKLSKPTRGTLDTII